ncbi:hypothetical protein [Paenibacillus taichungensis]
MGTQDVCISISDFHKPALRSGEYVFHAEHEIKTPEDMKSYNEHFKVTVKGDRLSLPEGTIYKVFPNIPYGEFEGALPQVYLNQVTLPWERTSLQPGHPKYESTSWLGVFTFNAEENPNMQQLNFIDLVPQNKSVDFNGVKIQGRMPPHCISYPDLSLESAERPDSPCNVIDIPTDIFLRVAPTIEDLSFLACVVEESTSNCVDNPNDCHISGAVLGNRKFLKNNLSHCHLVNLENMGIYFPKEDGNPSTSFPTGVTHVRLVTLNHWRFSTNDEEGALNTLFENLHVDTFHYPLATDPPTSPQVSDAMQRQQSGQVTPFDAEILVQNALHMGFIPMDQHFRSSGKSVSWYRSAFAPNPVAQNIEEILPFSDSDAAVQYDPTTGMFDASYGIAWQLGQLMSRSEEVISSSIYKWRRNIKAKEVIMRDESELTINAENVLFAMELLSRRSNIYNDMDPVLPEAVVKWLCKLRLLEGVPVEYLIPHEAMLPTESMKIFYLDKTWLYACIDGAVSLGRIKSAAEDREEEFFKKLLEKIEEDCKDVRPNPKVATSYRNQNGVMTGFLLRSQIVTGWGQRLKAFGYADLNENIEIPILRFNISEDLMLCIFDGDVSRFVLQEPGTELHCGIDYNETLQRYETILRRLSCSHTNGSLCDTGSTRVSCFSPCPSGCHEPGTSLGEQGRVEISMRDDLQTIRVKQTVDIFMQKLTELQHAPLEFTSAHWYLELIEGAAKGVFNNSAHIPCTGVVDDE